MNIPHELNQEEAQQRIREVLKNVEARFGGQVKDLQQDWNGNEGKFSFSVMNMPITGTLSINNTDIALDSNLPFAASFFEGKIKDVIFEEAKKVLNK